MTDVTTNVQDKQQAKVESQFSVVMRRLKRDRKAMISLYLLIAIILACILVPIFSPYSYYTNNLDQSRQPPDSQFWLGTDEMGRDIFVRLFYGGSISLGIALTVVIIEVIIGIIMGSIAGYYGKWVDNLIMRITEVFMCFPFLILCITIIAVFADKRPEWIPKEGWSIILMITVLSLLGWPSIARIVRGQILSLRELEFMEACEALGISDRRRIFRHLLPNVMSSVIVFVTLGMASVILTETAISFLGLGVAEPTPTWGSMIQSARNTYNIENRWWYWIPPGFMIFISVMCFNLLGDGLRDALDPKMKQ